MFTKRRRGTVISEGLKVEGNLTSQGLVEVHGQIFGDMNCTSIFVGDNAEIKGTVAADEVVVNGLVEGPIHGVDVVLKSKAIVKGTIHHQSLVIEKGARFEGKVVPANRSTKARVEDKAKDKVEATSRPRAQPSKAATKAEPPRQAAE
ncbi:MAG: bactofilin family protein [Methyloligellaceae bacterium]